MVACRNSITDVVYSKKSARRSERPQTKPAVLEPLELCRDRLRRWHCRYCEVVNRQFPERLRVGLKLPREQLGVGSVERDLMGDLRHGLAVVRELIRRKRRVSNISTLNMASVEW